MPVSCYLQLETFKRALMQSLQDEPDEGVPVSIQSLFF